MKQARPLRLFSLWSVAALIALMIVELLPSTGPLLADVGAAYVAGWLAHVCLLALAADAIIGSLPRAAALIPMLAYGGYYVARSEQDSHLRLRSEEVRNGNPGTVLKFDPSKYSLVMDGANEFVASHAIPVVYARDPAYRPEGYVSFRLPTPRDAGSTSSSAEKSIRIDRISVGGHVFDDLATAEKPEHSIVAATVSDDPGQGWKDWNIGGETTSIAADGRTVGVFRSAYARRLPVLPFLRIGCSFSPASSARRCEADFITEHVAIESRPRTIDRDVYDDPVSIMLGIRKYSAGDLAERKTAPVDRGVETMSRPMALDENPALAALQDVVRGQNPAASWSMVQGVGQNPARLAPLAAAMANRFIELDRTGSSDAPGKRLQLALLAAGISALDPLSFAAVEDRLTDFPGRDHVRQDYPLLYVRLGDVGQKLFPIYRDHFLAKDATLVDGLLAALAICRIGIADSELISEMKARLLNNDGDAPIDAAYRTALFVTLIKLGQENPTAGFSRLESPALRSWRNDVLAGRGRSAVGPNNCMPLEWPLSEDVPSIMSPGLQWARQRWESSPGSVSWPIHVGTN